MIITQDNFNSTNYFPINSIKPIGKYKKDIEADKKVIGGKLEITLKDYRSESINNNFFSFFRDEEKIASKNEDDLIPNYAIAKN